MPQKKFVQAKKKPSPMIFLQINYMKCLLMYVVDKLFFPISKSSFTVWESQPLPSSHVSVAFHANPCKVLSFQVAIIIPDPRSARCRSRVSII